MFLLKFEQSSNGEFTERNENPEGKKGEFRDRCDGC